MKSRKWLNKLDIQTGDRNVIPIDDIDLHIEDHSCSCNPKIEIIGSKLLIVHNAWDNREIFEEIEESIKNRTL